MTRSYAAVVIGASAGGIAAVTAVLRGLPATFHLPVILALHIRDRSEIDFASVFHRIDALRTVEAAEKDLPRAGYLHVAPAGYHLLLERDHSFSLSNDDMVNWARPSIDVLFESAAEAYGAHLIGILLTGANRDGALGLRTIMQRGGMTIAQHPASAEVATMPAAAIAAGGAVQVLDLAGIHAFLASLASIRGSDGL